MNPKDVLTSIEVAELLDCEPSTVDEQARRRELPGLKVGRSWIFPRAALVHVLNDRAMKAMSLPAANDGNVVAIGQPRTVRQVPPELS